MKLVHFFLYTVLLFLVSCGVTSNRDSIGNLRNSKVDLTDVKIEGGLEKAMQSYQKFLEQTPDSAMTPEALRRLADLKIQKEYGTLEGASAVENKAKLSETKITPPVPSVDVAKISPVLPAADVNPPEAPVLIAKSKKDDTKLKKSAKGKKGKNAKPGKDEAESTEDFEKRASSASTIKAAKPSSITTPDGAAADLQNAGALEAIALYKKLLIKYPNYDRNDQVLYQLSRAYEEIGQVEEAMKIMNRIVKEYPKSRYFDEVQFRRGNQLSFPVSYWSNSI